MNRGIAITAGFLRIFRKNMCAPMMLYMFMNNTYINNTYVSLQDSLAGLSLAKNVLAHRSFHHHHHHYTTRALPKKKRERERENRERPFGCSTGCIVTFDTASFPSTSFAFRTITRRRPSPWRSVGESHTQRLPYHHCLGARRIHIFFG